MEWRAFSVLLVMIGVLSACSQGKSQDTWRVVACWLRPSCLPSQLPSPSKPTPQKPEVESQPAPAIQPRSSPAPVTASPKPVAPSPETLPVKKDSGSHVGGKVSVPHSPPCRPFVSMTVPPERQSLHVSYREPVQRADGTPLDDLVKTTIFQDSGRGFVKVKDVPATQGTGGGLIEETIPISESTKTERTIRICVTATNARGLESPRNP